ncbi:MAG: hypothetical protein CL820_03525 [Croceicoccus sp.]|nr:hypothetical protein [Croceicoccus sp.]MAL24956.1 hypothetical protein [Croceicoccus sp.]|tara:strand:- start:58240 stop:58815 length:576 start_codon:yes stop_codon:yes gene_type:complete
MGDVILLTGYLLAVAGVLVLRLSWGLAGRSRMLNAAGWAALAAAVLCGAVAAGAWGITVVSLWATATAFVLLAVAGWTAQPSVRRASDRRAGMLPEGTEPLRLGGRVLTFAIVAVLSMAASIAAALFVRWAALLCGAAEGNASVLALFAAPLVWTMLAYLLLMTGSRKRQFAILGGTILTALPPVLSGAMT